MNNSKTGRWFLLVCLALAPSTAVLAEPPSDGPTQQRLIVRRAAASVWKAEPPGDCPFPKTGYPNIGLAEIGVFTLEEDEP